MTLGAARHWRPGEVVVRREVWRGQPYSGIPVIVVRDEPQLLAVYLPEGSPFAFPDGQWPCGRHPWSGFACWEGHGLLMLHRPDDAYGVFVFWEGQPRTFSRWYLNLQAPFRRTSIGFDTLDHELDLWSADGRTWHWKDDDVLDRRVAEGHFTAAEAAAFRAEATRLETELGNGQRWWTEAWAHWTPDPEWPRPTLPPGWQRV